MRTLLGSESVARGLRRMAEAIHLAAPHSEAV